MPTRTHVGTHKRELYQFDENARKIQPVNTQPLTEFFQKLDINTLCEDAAGNVWIGTYNSGLLRWNPQTGVVRHFTSSEQPGDLGSQQHHDDL